MVMMLLLLAPPIKDTYLAFAALELQKRSSPKLHISIQVHSVQPSVLRVSLKKLPGPAAEKRTRLVLNNREVDMRQL